MKPNIKQILLERLQSKQFMDQLSQVLETKTPQPATQVDTTSEPLNNLTTMQGMIMLLLQNIDTTLIEIKDLLKKEGGQDVSPKQDKP